MPSDAPCAEGGDVLTVLRAADRSRLAKVHTYTGKQGEASIETQSAPKGFEFYVERWPIDGLGGIAAALADLAHDPSRAVIPGELIEGRDPSTPLRRIKKQSKNPKTKATDPPNFEDCRRRWLAVDLDKVPNLEGHNPADDPDGAAEYLLEHIPPELSAASFALQWTASQNLDVAKYGKGPPKTLSGRLWFWLDKPLSHAEAKHWLDAKRADGARLYPHIDPSLYQAVALHYTAAPVWIGRPDPLPRRVMIWRGESDVVAVPNIEITSPAARANLDAADFGPLDIAETGEALHPAKRERLTAELAAAWPSIGARHPFSLAVAGGMLGQGVPTGEARAIIYRAASMAGDEEPEARVANVDSTADELRLGHPVTRWPKAAELAGDREALERARKACAPKRTILPPLPKIAPEYDADGLVDLEEGQERIAGATGEWCRAAAEHNGWSEPQEPSAGLDLNAPASAPVHAVNVTMGGGKTHVAIGMARQLPPAETLYHAVSDHALSRDLETRYRGAGNPARTVKGLGQTANDGRPMCHHFENIMAPWIEAGQRAYDLCQTCPDRGDCPTQEQRDDKATPGVAIGPYNYLTLSEDSRPFPTPGAIIIDENPMAALVRGADKPVRIELGRLANPPADFGRGARPERGKARPLIEGSRTADVRDTCRMAHKALASGDLTTGALRAAGLDAERCAEARFAWYDRKAEIEPPSVDEFNADGVAAKIEAGQALGDRDALRMARLFRMLESYLADGRADADALNGLEIVTVTGDDGIERPHVALYWREEIKADCPILLLDGTLNELIARKLFPSLTAITNVRIEAPHCRVAQVVEGGLSMRRLGAADGLSDKDAKGGANKRRKVMDLAEVAAANTLPDANGTRAVVATYKRTRKDIERERKDRIDADAGDAINGQWTRLEGGIDLAHEGHMRGVDRWGGTPAIIIAGRPLPRPDALERLARAIFWDDPEPIQTLPPGERLPQRLAGIRMRDGSGRGVMVPTHPDPRCAAVLDQICRAEVEQIAHRLRLVRRTADNPATVYLLTEIPIDISVDELATFEGLAPDPLELMLARGVLPEGWPLTAAVMRDRFASSDACRKWFTDNPETGRRRGDILGAAESGDIPLIVSKGKISAFSRYRVKPAQGNAQFAWLDVSRHPEPRAAFEFWLGLDGVISVAPAPLDGATGEAATPDSTGENRTEAVASEPPDNIWANRPGAVATHSPASEVTGEYGSAERDPDRFLAADTCPAAQPVSSGEYRTDRVTAHSQDGEPGDRIDNGENRGGDAATHFRQSQKRPPAHRGPIIGDDFDREAFNAFGGDDEDLSAVTTRGAPDAAAAFSAPVRAHARARTGQRPANDAPAEPAAIRPLPIGLKPQPEPPPRTSPPTWTGPGEIVIARHGSFFDPWEPPITFETGPSLEYARAGGDNMPADLREALDVLRRNRRLTWDDVDAEMRELSAGRAPSRTHLSNARTGTFDLSPAYARAVVAWAFAELGLAEPPPPDPDALPDLKGDSTHGNRTRPIAGPPGGEGGPTGEAGGEAPTGGREHVGDLLRPAG